MTSRYRVEYALKQHRRDEFIEWIKGLLAGPFVLHAVKSNGITPFDDLKISADAKRRYAEVFADIENLVNDHIKMCDLEKPRLSRLSQLVPSIGEFFTLLPLEKAFYIQDESRSISKRRLVCPSFNDIRIILNTAQILQLSTNYNASISGDDKLKLLTFDGDVTLYEDGKSLEHDSELVSLLLTLLAKDFYIGIVTAAGYKESEKYYERLHGLIDIITSSSLTLEQKERFLVMGGEANYLFRYNNSVGGLRMIDQEKWLLNNMLHWDEQDILRTLDFSESILEDLQKKLELPALIIRKERGVGIIPKPGHKLIREQLEEIVLTCDTKLKKFPPAQRIEFCAFNGGNDVWVDIGDKSLGVKILQKYLGEEEDVKPRNTLHVGDQFAAIGANDYKARRSACTVWIANPQETKKCLEDLIKYIDDVYSIQL